MNPDTLNEVKRRLIADYGLKERGEWLQSGRCPSCDKKELFTRTENPWTIRCGRENNCGWEGRAKELYPEVFEGFNKRYKPTTANPNATADAYLQLQRGFELARIKGWYEQGKFWHPDAINDKGTATVRFYVDEARTVYMERFVEEVTLIDPETGEKEKRKAHFKGSHRGRWWQPPGMVINEGDTVYMVEACLDAMALILNGFKAVALLSCVNYPEKMLAPYKGQNITWVLALDNDKAGRKYIKKHIERMRAESFEIAAAIIPQWAKKTDWNDLHQTGRLNSRLMDEYRYRGALLIAQSPTEKALLMYEHDNRTEFPFEYNNRLKWFNLNIDKFHKAKEQLQDRDTGLTEEQIKEQALKESNAIIEIANCYPQFLYFQANPVTDESWYYARVRFPHDGAAVKNTFTGSQLSSASEFKKRLLSIAAGSVFTGSSQQLDRIMKDQLYNIKTVQTVDFVGYSKEHGCYVYNDIAIKDGELFRLNDEDFFDMGRLSIKSLNQSVSLHINANRDHYKTDWIDQLYRCFGAQGIVALAFWMGSLFAEQIRAHHKSFPFIEIVGEPGAGKSTLIEFLWKLVGRRDYEGFDPSKSTMAARARNMAQVSNMPIVLIESDREDTSKGKSFDWDELKTAYNGRSVRSRGMKNSGNETYEPPFRGTIVISQNAPVNASQAILERIVHMTFTRAAHSEETRNLAVALEQTPMEQLSGFLIDAARKESPVLKIIKENATAYERALMGLDEVKTVRLAKNHSQLMALVDALAVVVPLPAGAVAAAHDTLEQMAMDRQRAINSDHPFVQEFWDIFEYLDDAGHLLPLLNHAKGDDSIAINLNHFQQVAMEKKQNLPCLISDLKKHLKTSKRFKFIDIKPVASAIWSRSNTDSRPKTVKCWVFKSA